MHTCRILFINLLAVVAVTSTNGHAVEQAAVGELFTYKIEPVIFNWTHQVINEQFRYRPSLKNYPDLPSWMRYMYSHEHHAGFLYGTPPDAMTGKTFDLDIIALNKQNYETRYIQLTVTVQQKVHAPNVVQMKIDNLDWVHLMDPGRVENLKNIFRKNLWPESDGDLNLVFMESAVNMGGRLPLRPQQREGVIVHLGSSAEFSERLKELQEEVRPLYKLPSCTYKRTSVQKIFENAGFKLDWCAFKMVGVKMGPEILFHNHDNNKSSNGVNSNDVNNLKRRAGRWHGMARDEAPVRNYIDEFAFAFAIPGMIFAILFGMLSVILCFQHGKLRDPVSEFFFENIFHVCEESCTNQTNSDFDDERANFHPTTTSTVQMVQCLDTKTQPITTLKSLKDPNCLLDNTSAGSQSPNSSSQIDNLPDAYLRPKPPPYKGGTLNRSSADI